MYLLYLLFLCLLHFAHFNATNFCSNFEAQNILSCASIDPCQNILADSYTLSSTDIEMVSTSGHGSIPVSIVNFNSLQNIPRPDTTISNVETLMELTYQLYKSRKATINNLWAISELTRSVNYSFRTFKSGSAPDLKSIQKVLENDQCLITYYHQNHKDLPNRLYTFLITRDSVYFQGQTACHLNTIIQRYLHQITQPPVKYAHKEEYLYNIIAIDSLGWQLKNILLPNFVIEKFNELIIIPHKEVGLVPFASLPNAKIDVRSVQSWKTYSFLCQDINIGYAFSGLWWLQGRYPLLTEKSLLYTPKGNVSFLESSVVNMPQQFSKIKDIQHLRSLLSLNRFQLLYIGMHGDENALKGNPTDNDFRPSIHLSEIAELDLTGMAVVLAACESAKIYPHTTDSYTSFAHQAAKAGANNICAAIWKVPDLQTGQIFKPMFLNGQLSIADLNALINKYLRDCCSIEKHPYYWAAWVSYTKRDATQKNTDYTKAKF